MSLLFVLSVFLLSVSGNGYVANNATLVLLKNAAQRFGAVSLDGSPGAIYVKLDAETTKVVVLQKGGAWCTSIGDCYSRSKSALGSTTNYPDQVNLNLENEIFGGQPFPILSNNQSYSPQFWNWTKIFLPYTDGGSQIGDLTDPIHVNNTYMYFRGYRILQSIQEYLSNLNNQACDIKTDIGCGILQNATDVVITGGSAGSLATFLHADQWLNYIPNSQQSSSPVVSSDSSSSSQIKTSVVAIPDSGFFLDYGSWHDEMVWVVEAMNGTSHLPALCLENNPTNRTRCFFAEHVAPYLQVPFFALQSEYDAYQITAELHAQPTDNPAINQYGQLLTNTIYTNLIHTNSKHGMFLDSCYHHTRYWGDIIINGLNCAEAIQVWYNDVTGKTTKDGITGQHVWFQNQTYPCPNCCTGGN